MRPQKENQPQRPEALETVDKTIEKAQEHLEKSSIIRILSRSLPDIRICSMKPCKGGLTGEEVGEYPGDLKKTSVFIECSEKDLHIPLERVNKTENVLNNLNAEVEKTIYPGKSHKKVMTKSNKPQK